MFSLQLLLLCRIQKNLSDPISTPVTEPLSLQLLHKVVDLRKEKAIIKGLSYLMGMCTVRPL